MSEVNGCRDGQRYIESEQEAWKCAKSLGPDFTVYTNFESAQDELDCMGYNAGSYATITYSVERSMTSILRDFFASVGRWMAVDPKSKV